MMNQEHHPAYINPGVRPSFNDQIPRMTEYNFNKTYNRRPGEAPVLSFPSETNVMHPLGQGMDSSGMFTVQASGDLDTDFPSGAFAAPPSTDSLKQFPFTDKTMTPQGPNPQAGLPMPPQGPILANPAQPQPQAPVLSVPSMGATGNARGSSRIPSQKIGMHEAMMRMGGATMAASSQGALAGLGAMTDSYGQIQDYNRAREMEAFEIEEARRQAIADRQARAQAAAAKADKGDTSENLIGMQASYDQMSEALAALKKDNLTGPFAGRLGAWLDASGLSDYYRGNDEGAKRAYMRSILANIQVDDTLLKTANTKGAISDKEMELFKSPLPKITDDEGLWRLYITERMDVLSKVIAFERGQSSGAGDYTIEEVPS